MSTLQIYLASGNEHKLTEFIQLARGFELDAVIHSPKELGGMPPVIEDGESFEENARKKAAALLDSVPDNAWVLADDSGLMVDALDGEPGVHSARFAGPTATAAANNIKLLKLLHGIPMEKRTARFMCVLCFQNKNHPARIFTGSCKGHIMTSPSGKEGFGYDPLFRPVGYSDTLAMLGYAIKNSLSHRGKAVGEWAEFVRELTGQDSAGT